MALDVEVEIVVKVAIPYISEFFRYMENYKDIAKNTVVNYRIDLQLFMDYTKGKASTDIRVFKNFTDYLLREKKDARSTINRRLSALKSYYNYLYDEKIINVDVSPKIKYVRNDTKKIKEIMAQKDIFAILSKINDVRDRALLETLYATGVREGELVQMNIQDVDFENEWVLIVHKTKSRKHRIVPINKEALKWIKAYIGVRKDGPIFLNNRAGRLGERSVYTISKHYFDLPPHDLRHSFATHMMMRTGNTKAVSEMLGHANEKMTEQMYTHMRSKELSEIYKKSRGMERD